MNKFPDTMRAMIFEKVGQPLVLKHVPVPKPEPGQALIKVLACGVCRTDLHIVDGDLREPKPELIPGHEIVGEVAQVGRDVTAFSIGDRVGVPWLGKTDGKCKYCRRGQENLCLNPVFTGYTLDGGFAEYTVAYQDFMFHMPDEYPPVEGAPLLCAGLIGYRSYRMAGEALDRLGLYGFGAAAHILCQIAAFEGKKVYAFTRPGDEETQTFARELGAVWAGGSETQPPEELDAAIIFAPVGNLVKQALNALARGGVVVCAGIYMSEIPAFPYDLLWQERAIRSVANLTRKDGEELLRVAPQARVRTRVTAYPLEEANKALDDLRAGRFDGAAVLVP